MMSTRLVGPKGQLPQQLGRLLESITHTAGSNSLVDKKKFFEYEKFEAVTMLRVSFAMRSTQCNWASYYVAAWRLAHNQLPLVQRRWWSRCAGGCHPVVYLRGRGGFWEGYLRGPPFATFSSYRVQISGHLVVSERKNSNPC